MRDDVRVLHVAQRDTRLGGAPKVAIELAKAQAALGYDARVLFLYGDEGPAPTDLGKKAVYCRYANSGDLIRNPGRLRNVIRQLNPEILHHHDMLLFPRLVMFFDRGKSFQKVVTHAHIDAGIRSFGVRTLITNMIIKKTTDHWIAVSEPSRETWLEFGVREENVTTIDNGVAIESQSAGALKQQQEGSNIDVQVGFLGRLNIHHKGIDTFLDVLAYLPDNFSALVAGAGEDEVSIRSLIEAKGLADRVTLCGQVITPDFLAKIDLLLFTSRFETFGLVPLEAVACRVPVFAMKADGGANELLAEFATHYQEDRDAASMAGSLRSYFEKQEQDLEALESRSLEVLGRFSWFNSARSVAHVYAKVLAE